VAEGADGEDEVVLTAAVDRLRLGPEQVGELVRRQRAEMARRVARYRGDRPLTDVRDRDVILVDDGLATGVTAEAALRALRRRGPARLVLAVPVCAPDTAERLRAVADDVVCVVSPSSFVAVGFWYDDFGQTGDDEVLAVLGRPARATTP
jgi:predicted phosphoribosyltransferase